MEYTDISMIGDISNRFILKKKGHRQLVVLGVNPSTADESVPDATIRKVMGFAERWGYDGFIMINLYPQRATNPNDLPLTLDHALHQKNINHIFAELSQIENPVVLVAYGNIIGKRKYLNQCKEDIANTLSKLQVKYIRLGDLTAKGHPRHPLMCSYTVSKQNHIL